ncbi:hypothetical protein DQM68_11240 [Leptospira mayottensis]|uniref:Uncharacterized protein n=2 Tax=Leptospira mayottensis TaxID=1137606 RepID=A0AA87MLP1_9LEPT|nr:hypothetical protein DQM68_11240 [Leptospira mayottensis]AXR65577.1 hypothetical protein DQM28_16500 [Leptospira mayottensis]AZQ02396.1 hypothetical protein LEP1GSC190_10465 [Leptospira mayottensis 200901116]EKR98645.1 hypothetical protein LEP1GSC125_1672 [Leptospira mayottensis 200901122]TGN16882.1 hypothetical protein EHR03_03045 [Leptospira mayottensis]
MGTYELLNDFIVIQFLQEFSHSKSVGQTLSRLNSKQTFLRISLQLYEKSGYLALLEGPI